VCQGVSGINIYLVLRIKLGWRESLQLAVTIFIWVSLIVCCHILQHVIVVTAALCSLILGVDVHDFTAFTVAHC
jgi:hypothetical protein